MRTHEIDGDASLRREGFQVAHHLCAGHGVLLGRGIKRVEHERGDIARDFGAGSFEAIGEDAGRQRGDRSGGGGGRGRAIEAEERDRAGFAFIEHGEIRGLETGDGVALLIEDGDGDFNELGSRAKYGRGLLRGEQGDGKSEGGESHLAGV